jgi:hypothetical protein
MPTELVIISVLYFMIIPTLIVIFDTSHSIIHVTTKYEFILNMFLWPIAVLRRIIELLKS